MGLCWCNSGIEYENCHKAFDEKCLEKQKAGYLIPPKRMIKNKFQIDGIRQAGHINDGLLDLIQNTIKERMTTEEIDKLATIYLKNNDSESADFRYQGYPKHLCTSINEVVCHGIPSNNVILKDGDIINVDVTISHKGYYADASRMFEIGTISPRAKRLIKVTKECLLKGLEAIKPYESTLNDIGLAIEKHAHKNGYTVVEEYCGHGVGLKMHEDPYVLHYSVKEKTYLIVPGMVFTIEPMINEGKKEIILDFRDGWTVRTKDKKLSAQVENTILITEDGYEIISS